MSGEVQQLSLPLDVETDSVQQFLMLVAQAFGLHSANIKLVRKSKVLQPFESLREAQVRDGDSFSLVVSKTQYAVTASRDNTVRLWDVNTGKCTGTLQHPDEVAAASPSPDCLQILTTNKRKLRLWSTLTRQVQVEAEPHGESDINFACYWTRKEALSCSEDKTAKVLDARTLAVLMTLEGHDSAVVTVSGSKDGSMIATGSQDKTVRIWRREDGGSLRVLKSETYSMNPTPSPPGFTRDGKNLLFFASEGAASVIEVETGDTVQHFDVARSGCLFVASFTPDEKQVLTISESGELRLWSRRSSECVFRYFVTAAAVRSCAFSLDGAWVLTCSFDGCAKLWETRSGKLLQVFRGHKGSLFHGALMDCTPAPVRRQVML